ncbi:McrC family protein [Streptococcus mutans]|uniref:McrC family protein n=1 Tax=Streptococcus mutans TaxID=1309 RepID=UPI0023AEAFBF|nr:McrC family protein [Streptococcus mutans]MDE8030100.1 McrC family protein [Streptococcus mutans]MDT9488243.1 3-isopropylmalate dehydrogenase [Streptococcus mutans]MDT9491996.1 3-isopropylmalate dehydrogenase [Streptococcus mutans]MDT9508900.1 3-isopropylmalate dehydrogenase [Streptococcus mutans]MDT9532836.1 3-isopropylmalate dehydrogenase [Streptococcus mutans]
MRLTDNFSVAKSKFEADYPQLSEKLLDRTLESLSQEDNILIFPHDLLDSPDLEKDGKVLETVNGQIKTQNIIGFLGCGDERLTIHSRFTNEDDDYFLHYMLQKVLQLNLTSLDVGLSQEDSWCQLLIYLFPKYLQAALRKGLYKEYQRFFYNDSHVKGTIEVARHIKKNVPFTGKITYSTREFSFDNALMQLIRHMIVFIQHTVPNGRALLSSSASVRENTAEIVRVTPSYKFSDRAKIIHLNQTHPIRHAYYYEYGKLQQLCLMILRQTKHGLNQSNQKIHSLLFDVAWLWEEYLATLLGEDFEHPQNKASKGGISVFQSGNGRKVYPDFYSRPLGVVLDAKYKKLETTEKGIAREDLFQLITYSYISKAQLAGLIFPSTGKEIDNDIGTLEGYGGILKKWSLLIPQKSSSYDDFVKQIQESEKIFQETIQKLLNESECTL